MDQAERNIADAVLGIDTLWGGDVMCPSGTGRFIADSWFSDEPLPLAYTLPAAARIRASGGVSSPKLDREALQQYLGQIDVTGEIEGLRKEAQKIEGLRGPYLASLASSLATMWELAREVLGQGEPVPYEKCVKVATGRAPEPSRPEGKRQRVTELLANAAYSASGPAGILGAVDQWRRDRLVPMASVRALGAAVIARFNELC